MKDKEAYEMIEHSKQNKSGENHEAELFVISPAAVESIGKKREEMLEAIQKYVPASLVERLRLKVAREQQLLREGIEREQRMMAAGKKAVHVLNQKFFKVVRLEQQFLD
ncbi:MAG TPA: hypothetical protein VMV71_00010 [Candidatus Paceibacterota bacterium]|nr:hypothetical protein [Candidatus Paceibacterota bacterium]